MGPLFAYGGKTKGSNLEKYGGELAVRKFVIWLLNSS